jgi:hypothetical protein
VDDHAERLSQLDALGFDWNPSESTFARFMEALKMFKQLHGHTRVGQMFIVPVEPPWPEHLHRFRLGSKVVTVRTRGDFVKSSPKRRLQLEALGFDWDPPHGRPAARLSPSEPTDLKGSSC